MIAQKKATDQYDVEMETIEYVFLDGLCAASASDAGVEVLDKELDHFEPIHVDGFIPIGKLSSGTVSWKSREQDWSPWANDRMDDKQPSSNTGFIIFWLGVVPVLGFLLGLVLSILLLNVMA